MSMDVIERWKELSKAWTLTEKAWNEVVTMCKDANSEIQEIHVARHFALKLQHEATQAKKDVVKYEQLFFPRTFQDVQAKKSPAPSNFVQIASM